MIDRWCVWCGKTEPSPFTKKCLAKIMTHLSLKGETTLDKLVVDLGCGNGRNSNRFYECGFMVRAFDMNPDCVGAEKLRLGIDKIPVESEDADVVLANYSMMFLSPFEVMVTLMNIANILSPDGMFIWELYPAKDSECNTVRKLAELQKQIVTFSESKKLIKVYLTKDKGFYTGTKLFR